jgi:hypothetical protein
MRQEGGGGVDGQHASRDRRACRLQTAPSLVYGLVWKQLELTERVRVWSMEYVC